MPDSAPIAAIAVPAWDVLSQKAKSAVAVIAAWIAAKASSAVGTADVVVREAEWGAGAPVAGSARALAAIWGAKASHAAAS
ncbi:hypothetical protein GRO01_18360 [Gluconobacter roseus NBRC 3990]|uniref:Uncharacterized protein n=1 Tax=Gluconobacter roseus NBRC 3990 TaxID=1307950 RepID=A0A4Y3M4U3_9PROT|nr:hypothetical protein AA3990_2372 [Gluconobacter roseus NBRC 3990]GEB04260.1 hypothetical protein GRO01_18360 [Gluconobacter roseus NBRC 3990]GLP92703.1 hypothetical protein GCM10007871_06810 [Gluconobacter roseus NBRC 3990]